MAKLIVILLLLPSFGLASESCNRIAVVNYREIPVDTGNTPGEGLRYFLEKDPVSEELLNQYQEEMQQPKWSTIMSSTGSFMLLGSLLQTNDKAEGVQNKNTLLFGGALLVTLSFILTKTLQYNAQETLQNAVDQYNKRNSPRIYFSPYGRNNERPGVTIGVQQEF